jgi:hypothetical protein
LGQRNKIKILSIILSLLPTLLEIQDSFGQAPPRALDVGISFGPAIIKIEGKFTAYYELHVKNVSQDTLNVSKIEVQNLDDSTSVFSINKDNLEKRFSGTSDHTNGSECMLSPETAKVIYLEFPTQSDKSSIQLNHQIEYEIIRSDKSRSTAIHHFRCSVSIKPFLKLGRPLRQGPWTAVYNPSWQRGHRRVYYTVNGVARIPGRFAIDFIKMDSQSRYAKGDENIIENWHGYGDDVLAVSDGVVASMRDSFPESATLSEHPQYSAEKASGNYISLEIEDNKFVFYEHLKPGSIKVKPGEKVKRGDIIASLGFTGQTTGPHLHFHVADKDSLLGAEGLPFVFDNFTLLGRYSDFENFGKRPWLPGDGPSDMDNEIPPPNSVIKFSDNNSPKIKTK